MSRIFKAIKQRPDAMVFWTIMGLLAVYQGIWGNLLWTTH